jgi:exopolysaccharide biosynthesis polyprenyl glycosylphosphotransferase
MFKRQRKARVLFAISDVALLSLAFAAAYQTRALLPFTREFSMSADRKLLVLGCSIIAWIAVGFWLRIYDRLDPSRPVVVLKDSARQCAYGAVGLALFFQYVARLEPTLSRPFLLLYLAYTWAAMLLFRNSIRGLLRYFRREFGEPHYVMIAGVGDRAISLARKLEAASDYGVRLRGFLSEGCGDGCPAEIKLNALYKVYPVSELNSLLHQQVIDEVIFAVESESLSELEDVFLLCDEEGVRTRVAVDFFPHVNSTVSLDRFGDTPLLTFSSGPEDEIQLMLKRAMDVMIAGVALIVLAPFMLVVAILVKLTSPGPVIFRQVRCGLNGRRFLLYKFRSMCLNAEEMQASLEHLNTRQTAFKIPDDPRLTPIGRFLRKFSIDEWPQLWSILRGHMSLVGPRPAIPVEVERYAQWQRRRLRMRPGLTCIWAISGRDRVDFDTWMKLDLQYIDTWSLALDWKILLNTIPSVLTGRGAN